MAARRYSKKYRYKYRSIRFKLTYKQKDTVDRCARLLHTTPVKLIKASIRHYLEKYSGMLEEDSHVADNQLTLFDKDHYGEQLTIFNEIEED